MPGVTTAYQTGVHGSRPAATSGCILYSCTTHNKVYRSDGSAWSDWLSIAAGASSGTPSLTFGTAAAAGSSGAFVNTDATLPIFDATAPSTQAFGDSAAVGAAAFAARRDHKHGIPSETASPVAQLADSLLGSDTASFDFTSISGSYKHLRIEVQGQSTVAATNDNIGMKFNNDGGANYDYGEWALGSGSSIAGAFAEAFGQTSIPRIITVAGATSSAGDVGSATITIPDYAGTVLNKSAHAEGGAMLARSAGNVRFVQAFASWRSTAAITRVTLTPAGGNWKTGSRATLYGLS